jgi:hypothetical protein|tara:strand:- start:221 stop:352 length:132 start_codon:yes stop_codon:yes gene_type:complete
MALKGGEVLSVPAYMNVRYGNRAKNARCTANMIVVGVAYNEPV